MKRLPAPLVFTLAASISLLVAILGGIIGAVVCVFLYDRGRSKGNDLAVSLIALHTIGTFIFISLLTFLWTRRGSVSWKIPIGCFTACLCALALDTVLFSSAYDEYFAIFFWAAWVAITLSGLAALGMCRQILHHAKLAQHSHSPQNS
jgi:uncharacterized membrane protein YeaQ/YmgE (transglycosylase-associated protein family)